MAHYWKIKKHVYCNPYDFILILLNFILILFELNSWYTYFTRIFSSLYKQTFLLSGATGVTKLAIYHIRFWNKTLVIRDRVRWPESVSMKLCRKRARPIPRDRRVESGRHPASVRTSVNREPIKETGKGVCYDEEPSHSFAASRTTPHRRIFTRVFMAAFRFR